MANGYTRPVAERKALAGYKTASKKDKGDQRRCAECRFVAFESGTNGWGGVSIRVECGEPRNGFAVAESAVCDRWERKL